MPALPGLEPQGDPVVVVAAVDDERVLGDEGRVRRRRRRRARGRQRGRDAGDARGQAEPARGSRVIGLVGHGSSFGQRRRGCRRCPAPLRA